jgi:hypothetical protein
MSYALENPAASSAASLMFRNNAKDPTDVAKALSVAHIFETNVSAGGSQVELANDGTVTSRTSGSAARDSSHSLSMELPGPALNPPTSELRITRLDAPVKPAPTNMSPSPKVNESQVTNCGVDVPVNGNAREIYRASLFTR